MWHRIGNLCVNNYAMKSIYHGKAGANTKLKGKITKMLACRCCDMYNWKWSEKIKEATKQIKEFKNGTID
jgi:hypothetical protein